MFFSESKGMYFLMRDWPLRLLHTAHWTELREMPKSLACTLIDLVDVALILFLRQKRSLGVLTVRVLDFLDLLSSGAPIFYSVDKAMRQARTMMSLVLCPVHRRSATFSLLGVTIIIL